MYFEKQYLTIFRYVKLKINATFSNSACEMHYYLYSHDLLNNSGMDVN